MAFSFRDMLKPLFVGVFFFISLSSSFITAYIFVDYQKYMKAHLASQIQESEAIKKRTQETFNNLKKLLSLTEARIQATYEDPKSHPKTLLQQIQNVLSSLHHLQFYHTLPELQKVSYRKFSSPQGIVTRFGVSPLYSNSPLNSKKKTFEKKSPTNGEAGFAFEEGKLKGIVTILNLQGFVEGVLEVQVEIDTFIQFLGTYQTVGLKPSFSSKDNQATKTPFFIDNKPPDTFLSYALAFKSHYSIFAVYILFTLVFIGFFLYILDLRLQKNYHHKFETLEESLIGIGVSEKASRKELGMYQQDAQIHKTSCQAQKKLRVRLKKRQQEQASHVNLSLKSIQQSFKNSHGQFTDAKTMEILETCIAQTNALSEGLWHSMNKEEVDFNEILARLQMIFAEKIHKLGITVETKIASEAVSFFGDSLLMEVLLVNAIGKPFHRVPKDGHVSISLKGTSGFLHLEIQDNGYAGAEVAEKIIRKSSGLFMTEEIFHQTCLNSGIRHRRTKANGLNITHLMIPNSIEEVSNNNVVQLFP